ncbi:MAG: glycoside hydrolase family 15 protein [Bacteroidota bacterium]
MSKHSYNSAIVGNCAFIAHVATDTNISWMCWPKFDSSFIFGSLLDNEKGGEFSILPDNEKYSSTQSYVENTNILSTRIECEEGSYTITDFAPRFSQYDRDYKPLMLIRKIQPENGTPSIRIKCRPMADYGKSTLKAVNGSNHIKFLGLDNEIRLTTNISLNYILDEDSIVLNETKYLVLTYGAPLEAPLETTSESFLRRTTRYWRHWVKTITISNYQQEAVIRSALALKIHQYEDTGAIIASSTTSLPESPGSGRTWDYRYCWLRDTYYTLNAFNNIGHFEEMERYFHYIANISTKSSNHRLQPLYTITGKPDIKEIELDLKGYQGNTPVRIGNQAYEHIQNDVYGQVLVSLLPLYIDRRFIHSERTESHTVVNKMLNKIEQTIDEKDAGLWEFRNFSQSHSYTFLFHWAGSNAAEKIALKLNDNEMLKKASELKFKAAEKIRQCWDKDRNVYTQAIETKNLDASTLQLIMMGFLDNNSQEAKNHLVALEKELKTKDGLFYRYKHKDDFGEPETTFLICAFWYVEALACVGRLDEAIEYFENLLKYRNHVGLLSEDVHFKDGSQWGNFPQTYSHVGLLNAAYRIAKKQDKPDFCC